MITWLRKNNTAFNENMFKQELQNNLLTNKVTQKPKKNVQN